MCPSHDETQQDEYISRLNRVIDYIQNHYDEELNLTKLAEVACFSKFHFHRLFRTLVGETLNEFVRRVRLEKSIQKLTRERSKSITQIALDCGFSSSQNFAKAFGQRFGMTPSTYRNSKHGNMNSKRGNAVSFHMLYDTDNQKQIHTPQTWETGMRVAVKEMPQYHVAYIRKMGPYSKETSRAFGELMQWAGPRGYLRPEMMLGILYWDNPEVTPPEKCRVDACLSVPVGIQAEAPIGMQFIHGGSYAVCQFEVKTDLFLQAWQDAFSWLVNSGYESEDQPCYESYHNNPADHPEGKWIFDICIPLKCN